MRSAKLGKRISKVEVGNISTVGFWLLVGDRELFLPFSDFPWFKDASVGELANVQLPHPGHLYWPDLDIDLATESIEHPERYPLVSRRRESHRRSMTRVHGVRTAARARSRSRG